MISKSAIRLFILLSLILGVNACSGTTGGGNLTPPSDIPQGPINAANPNGTLNPPGDMSSIGNHGREPVEGEYECVPGPDYSQALDKNPDATDARSLEISAEGTVDLKLLIKKYVALPLVHFGGSGSSSETKTVYSWASGINQLGDSYIRVIFIPAGKQPWEGRFRDYAIKADPTSEGYNVIYPNLHLSEGELLVYVKYGSAPEDETSESEKHLTAFADPVEAAYKKYVDDKDVSYLGKFKIGNTAN